MSKNFFFITARSMPLGVLSARRFSLPCSVSPSFYGYGSICGRGPAGSLTNTPFELPMIMAILADGSSYLDRYVEGVIEAEGFAASRRLLFLHLTLSGPRRLSRSSGMCSRIGSVTTLSKLGEARAKKKLRELNKCVVEFHSRCAVQSFFCRAERESLTGRALAPLGISQPKVRGGYRKPTARALPWRRFMICSARFRTTMPMS